MTILAKLWSQTEWGSPSDSETDPPTSFHQSSCMDSLKLRAMIRTCPVNLRFWLKKQATWLNLVAIASQKYAYCHKIGQPKPSRICIIFNLKLWKIIFIIFRPFWPEVSKLSFVSVSLLLDVTKIATIYRNYSLASGILRNILKACWPRCAFGRSSRTKQQICQCLNSVSSAVLEGLWSSALFMHWDGIKL